MKKSYLHTLIFFIASGLCSLAQTAPPFAWARNCQSFYNGTSGSGNYGTAICTDGNANNYTAGWFNGTIYFDTLTLSSAGANAYYLVSYDSSGNLRWAKQFGGNISLNQDIVYDHAGHIYTTGMFSNTISFDGINFYSTGQLNCHYIARFDTSGNFQWAKIF